MAKIGTAHVEIKPVLNEEALEEIAARIEQAVRDGVAAGIAAAAPAPLIVHQHFDRDELGTIDRPADAHDAPRAHAASE